MGDFCIKKGHDLKLIGKPEKSMGDAPVSEVLNISPADFKGIVPKLLVKEGDIVKTGTPLFRSKFYPDMVYGSPGSGTVSQIRIGERRKLQDISIQLSSADESLPLQAYTAAQIGKLSAGDIKSHMLKTGLWFMVRQRPFSKVANPDSAPKSIFISAMGTAPFSPDAEFVLEKNSGGFQTGLSILKKLTSGSVNLVMGKGTKLPALTNAKDVTIHRFSGPHPAGNVGIHIHHIDPIKNKDDIVWYVDPQDVAAIGDLFNTGNFPKYKVITVGGSGVTNRHYLKIRRGALVKDILKSNQVADDVRIISGDVLSGVKTKPDRAIGYYHNMLSVIPEGRKRYFLGWIMPGLKRYSLSGSFLSGLMGKQETEMTTAVNGSLRAIIPFGQVESVLPMDIMPTFLLKSILARDIEEMEKLGIYECDPEDFSLCAFSDVSKMEITEIIREGLEFMEAEG
ncbi:MAG: Na(+)-translocating NADH-quinone reductase subunit A [Candidatus Marinimicrobia bacterium]|nr:Na(+)-translocating NADH-quinone reductase subunit A [Candidatus Neomarinimicrobiota bacterium]